MESFHLHSPLEHWSNYKNNNNGLMVKTEKWVKHYSSSQKILLVGEGDFSFSLSLAHAFGSASNIFATSFDSYEFLIHTYKKATSNLVQLRVFGATILHDVDARKMKEHPSLSMLKFDCIVYNFPHAGFYGKEDNPNMIKMHQDLVYDFFHNARCLLTYNGEIHVTHKTKPPYSCWNLEELARENSLVLKERVPFDVKDYPFYENKRGHGLTSDEPFDCRDSYTYKFSVVTIPKDFLYTDRPPSLHCYFQNLREPLPRVRFIVKAEVRPPYMRAGCAGALVDEKQSILAKFLMPMPCTSTDLVELLAIKYALLIFEKSELCGRNVALDIVSDSNIAISWIKSQFGNPRDLEADLLETRMALQRIPNCVEFCYTSREYGSEHYKLVSELALEAMFTPKMYEAWLPYNSGI